MTELKRGFDRHGNPESRAFDLGGMDDDRVRGEKILLYICPISDASWDEAELKAAVAERGFQMDIMHAPRAGCALDETLLARYQQLWYVSTNSASLDTRLVELVADYVRRGAGLAIWADNEPYYADANLLARAITGSHFSGNRTADKIMTPATANQLAPGHFIEHPITQGMNNLYEGITICTISPAADVTLLGQSHDGQMCIGAFERGEVHVVLDTGFTKLYDTNFKKTAGTARYLRNIAFWLARGSRGVEYQLLTRARQGMTTIGAGQTSQPYTQTVTEPVELVYTLQWDGGATLGLRVRDPRGQIVFDQSSASAPLRATLPASLPGEWVCEVVGVATPGGEIPYVLTAALDRARGRLLPPAEPVTPVTPVAPGPAADQPYVPIYLLLDTSSAAGATVAALGEGVAQLAARLKARALPRAGARLAIVGTGGGAGLLAPLASPDQFAAPQLAGQGSSQLGAALRALLDDLPLRTARAKPLIVAVLASPPADTWTGSADQAHTLATNLSARVYAIGAGGYADAATLRRLTPMPPLAARSLTPDHTRELFDWFYDLADWAIGQYESKAGAPQPPPPPWLDIVR